MLRLLISAIIGLIIASVAVPQDTHLPFIKGEATGITSTPTLTVTGTILATTTGTTTSTPTTTPTRTPTATATEVVGAVCDCSGDLYNCSSFDTQPEAQACMEYCEGEGFGDIHGLDGNDDDGLACESLPPTWIVR